MPLLELINFLRVFGLGLLRVADLSLYFALSFL